ncbi:MAG TPA: multiheme c-type cytochrome ExtKL [Thermodesulfovibrionales bacterium]|nr:multiheme c-type cytochrome ExtKL [Thermodesulfovibrionales bacterium]
MKGFRGMLVLVMIIALPMTATAVQFDKKATTIDELAKMYDSTQCKSCHPDIYAQWEKSHHARPLMGIAGGLMMTPVVKSSAFAVKDPKQATLKTFPCFKCHLPQAFANADDSVAVELTEALFAASAETATDKEKADARAKVAKLQITCLVCHNEKAITHKLVLGKPENGVLYGNKEVASHPDATYKTVKKSVIMTQPIFCGQCHGTGPNFEFDYPVQCATLYGSYQHNYLSHGGFMTCQECHMKKVDGKADHLLAPDFNDKKETGELLSKSIQLDVQTLGYQFLRKAGTLIPMVVVNTKITQDAGHRIPDG